MRVEHPRWMDHKWQSYWRCDEEGHADCGIFYEPIKGHAYAIFRAPKYITHEEWDEIREYVVRACNSHEELVKMLEAAIPYLDVRLGTLKDDCLKALKLAKP